MLISSSSSADAIVEDIDEFADFVDIFRELGNTMNEQTQQYSEDWLVSDGEYDLGYQELTDEDIIAEVLNQNQTEVDPDSDVEQTQDVSPSQACNALEVVLEWLEAQGDVPMDHLLMVTKWRDRAAEKRKYTQKSISSFFDINM